MTQDLRDFAACLGISENAIKLQLQLAAEAGWGDTSQWTGDDLFNALGILCQADIDNMILAGKGNAAAIATEREQWELE